MRAAVILLALVLSASTFTGCSKKETEEVANRWVNNTVELHTLNDAKITVMEGIAGTLTLIEGNCMPMIGKNSTCREYPVKRVIKIYPYTTRQEAEQTDYVYFTLHAAPVATLETDAEGFYQARLAPGSYSVLVQENGRLYANGFDGQGGINPVQVAERNVSVFPLRLDYAVY